MTKSHERDWIKIDPRYEIRVAHRMVRISPPERWWERMWLDLMWALRRR